jgi:hypothetical protein
MAIAIVQDFLIALNKSNRWRSRVLFNGPYFTTTENKKAKGLFLSGSSGNVGLEK